MDHTGRPKSVVAVIGAGGFVGSTIARHLSSMHDVRCISRNPTVEPGTSRVNWPASATDPEAWRRVLAGADHVVNAAGLAHSDANLPDQAYDQANAQLPHAIGQAAKDAIPGRLIHISSIRAVAGAWSENPIGDDTPPHPVDRYGRSKRKGETLLCDVYGEDGRLSILRPCAVYGKGMKGNLAAMLRISRYPVPLPFAGLEARRSLLDVNALAEAVGHLLKQTPDCVAIHVISDRRPVTTGEIITAFRRGYRMPARLLPGAGPFLRAFRGLQKVDALDQRLGKPLVADPSGLEKTGWRPVENTLERLERLAYDSLSAGA